MVFRKKFLVGLLFEFIGILTAFHHVSDYRTISIGIFWAAIALAILGLIMMYKGIDDRKNHY